jgi:hypothetical protein
MKTKLSYLPINYLDSFGFEASGSIFWINALVGEEMLKISLKNILNINLSRDSLDCDDGLNVMQVDHEFRKMTASDFKDYQFIIEETNDFPELNLITFHSSIIITAICQEVEITKVDN